MLLQRYKTGYLAILPKNLNPRKLDKISYGLMPIRKNI